MPKLVYRDAVDCLDEMIQDTLRATKDVPHGLARYGVDQGIGNRLMLLKEVKGVLVAAALRSYGVDRT